MRSLLSAPARYGLTSAILLAACIGDELPTEPTLDTAPDDPAQDIRTSHRLVFMTEPSDVTAGRPINPVLRVAVQDADGVIVSDSGMEVSLALVDGANEATLLGARSARSERGVATFTELRIERAASGYRLRASAAGTTSVTSGEFSVHPAEAAGLAFTAMPDAGEGQALLAPPPVIEVRDPFGNRTPGWSGEVTLSLEKNPNNDTLTGATTVAVSEGVARFSDLSLKAPGKGLTLLAKASGLPPVESAPFNVRLTFSSVVASRFHTCAIGASQRAYCWGQNDEGQLGDGTHMERPTPAAVSGDAAFTSLTVGAYHTCGLAPGGKAYCWGNGGSGQLGDGQGSNRTTPVMIPSLTFTHLSAGSHHTCGLTTTGKAYCWGSNFESQLGDGSTTNRSTPTAVSTTLTFSTLSAGMRHTCGLAVDGNAYCWGDNGAGQLGDGTTVTRRTPVKTVGGLAFATLSAHGEHTCALTTPAREARCWGLNDHGELGDGSTTSRSTPGALSGGLRLATLSAGRSFTCGVDSSGKAHCWGRNLAGQLGDGTTTDRSIPGAVSSKLTFTMVSAGSGAACGTATNGETYCWGLNDGGQLGDGSTTNRALPSRVAGTER